MPAQLTLMNFIRTGFVDPWGFCLTVKVHLEHSCGIIKGEWPNHLFPLEDRTKRRRLFWWARFLLAGHAAIVAISVYHELWLLPILTTGGVFYGGWLRYLCNGTQHSGLQDDVVDFRLCTRTVILKPLARFLYWHMNYHIEHHMFPAVPCYNLGRLHEVIKHDLPRSPRGLIMAWAEIIGIAKRQRIDPEYQYIPQLPSPVGA